MSEPSRSYKGTWIPKAIMLAEDLTATERMLLAEVDSLDDGNGCWASNAFLAKRVCVSVGQVVDLFTGLRKKGYIVDRGFSGRFMKRSCTISSAGTCIRVEPEADPSLRVEPEAASGQNRTQPTGTTVPESTVENTREKKESLKAGDLAVIAEAWKVATGGVLPFGMIGKALKPLIVEHGAAEVQARLTTYLKSFAGNLRFASVHRFAATFGQWRREEGKWMEKASRSGKLV